MSIVTNNVSPSHSFPEKYFYIYSGPKSRNILLVPARHYWGMIDTESMHVVASI